MLICHRLSAEIIRALGFDVEDVRHLGMRYAEDGEIIEYSRKTGRVVVTRDLDFGPSISESSGSNHPQTAFRIYSQGA